MNWVYITGGLFVSVILFVAVKAQMISWGEKEQEEMNESRTIDEALMGSGRLRESMPRNPHWLHDPAVDRNAEEIRISIGGSCLLVGPADHTTETIYDRYFRVPGSRRWWYKIT